MIKCISCRFENNQIKSNILTDVLECIKLRESGELHQALLMGFLLIPKILNIIEDPSFITTCLLMLNNHVLNDYVFY